MATKSEARNGHEPGVAPISLKGARRERWLDLTNLPEQDGMPVEAYRALRIKLWASAPAHVVMDLQQSADRKARNEALQTIFLELDGPWETEEGEAFPSPRTPEFWDAIPYELTNSLIVMAIQEFDRLPSSLLSRNRT